ncbi:MAG: acylneuraminate cytidylyltransferase family protein [Rhodospirillaceae bacterium]|nr:MAG: acylneuraminate cytidylyltransferase family protein [Rhodospirillaceae bacterium]
MPDPARTLVVIPARGGSKRLPRKNVLPLGGKPLILHAVDVALAAATFGQVLVSTDDPEIKTVALSRKGVSVDDRASILAGDKVKVVDVIGELTDRPDIQRDFDVIGMLLPTCPFRTAEQVGAGFATLTTECDATISFSTYEFPPQSAVTLDDAGYMVPLFDPSPLLTGNTRSQDQPPTYRPNGAFFFTWIASFRRLRSFYTGRVKGVTMPRLNSVDIDDAQDFQYAQFLIDSSQIKVA